MNPSVKPGDVFTVVASGTEKGLNIFTRILRLGINSVQKLWSSDSKSDTPHTGFITDLNGGTFESLERISRGNLFRDYKGAHIRVYRNEYMSSVRYVIGWAGVKHHENQIYPGWRFLWHLFPPLARWIHVIDIPVCSELVSKFLYYAGLRHKGYMGTNVDTLSDELEHYRVWTKIFDGVIE